MQTKIKENESSIISHKEKNIYYNKNKPNENIFEKDSKFNLINLNHQFFPLINLIIIY